ncbi:MAG: PilZ domain-containing protein [Candidatus Omnitrophica bacterium]|nr:PilZ domain-containing protein [Candidatus Omnitrophota bacterium]
MSVSSSEKRRQPRVDNSLPVKISTDDIDLVTETKNISSSGVYCRVSKFLEPMARLRITLMLPVKKTGKTSTKKVLCGGVVVRTENIPDGDGFNTAIFFNDIHPRDSRVLAQFVDKLLSGKDPVVSKARS